MIYRFGKISSSDPELSISTDIVGGKAASLFEMSRIAHTVGGFQVPAGFVISTELCKMGDPQKAVSSIWDMIPAELDRLREISGTEYPIVSVRSGAPVSMPGMMDTILNVGLTSHSLNDFDSYWHKHLGYAALEDIRCRQIEMMGTTVFGQPKQDYHNLKEINAHSNAYQELFESYGTPFPDKLSHQLAHCMVAVLKSWNSDRAVAYRNNEGISHDMGTAITVQLMVFGNKNKDSCSGVVFTRDPSLGNNVLSGEFVVKGQGEDVVSGVVTPQPIKEMFTGWKWGEALAAASLDLRVAAQVLEEHYGDMMDIEFTVEDGVLYLLQCRKGKRTATAALKIAMEMDNPKLASTKDYWQAQQKVVVMETAGEPDLLGLPACIGAASGEAVFSSKESIANPGSILITEQTLPEDYEGMVAAAGIITATGGATSHAAVVARHLNKPCIVGAGESCMFLINKADTLSDNLTVTIDGAMGCAWFSYDNETCPAPEITSGSDSPVVKAFCKWLASKSNQRVVYEGTDEIRSEMALKPWIFEFKTDDLVNMIKEANLPAPITFMVEQPTAVELVQLGIHFPDANSTPPAMLNYYKKVVKELSKALSEFNDVVFVESGFNKQSMVDTQKITTVTVKNMSQLNKALESDSMIHFHGSMLSNYPEISKFLKRNLEKENRCVKVLVKESDLIDSMLN